MNYIIIFRRKQTCTRVQLQPEAANTSGNIGGARNTGEAQMQPEVANASGSLGGARNTGEAQTLPEVAIESGNPGGARLIGEAQMQPEAANAPCRVCLLNPKDTVLIPCGHTSMCSNCVSHLQATGVAGQPEGFYLCPICQVQVTMRQKINYA